MSELKNHLPYWPEGSGFYGDHTDNEMTVIGPIKPTIQKALGNITVQRNITFTLCDYGAADGAVSMNLFDDIIKWIKERNGNDQQVHIIYEDQPPNDFKSLFYRIHGMLPGSQSYYHKYDGVFVTACGTSFYSQCLPDDSVHLGFSSTALHWLSKSPCRLDDAIFHLLSKNEEQRRMFAEQAATDWETFLLHRTKELKQDGQLVIACMAVDDNEYYSGMTPSGMSVLDCLTDCWSEMLQEGKITNEEMQNTQLSAYFRREEEFRGPFIPGSPVYEAGLRMLSTKLETTRCPHHLKWLQQGYRGGVRAAEDYAAYFVPKIQMWSNSSFLAALGESRSTADKAAVLDELYRKYEARVAEAPEKHALDYVYAYIHIGKV